MVFITHRFVAALGPGLKRGSIGCIEKDSREDKKVRGEGAVGEPHGGNKDNNDKRGRGGMWERRDGS